MANKTGAIVIMSHIGNWELAAQMLNRKGLPIMLYLGAKHKEQVEAYSKGKTRPKRHQNSGNHPKRKNRLLPCSRALTFCAKAALCP